MERRIAFVGIAMVLLATPGARAQAPIGGDWREDVDRFARRVLEAGLTPGLGLAVSHGGQVVHVAGFGSADVGSGRGVGEETAFYIASTTKALTATAVALLAERGVLDLRAPVTRYLPDLRFRAPLAADSVTIHDLLTMTHGIEGSGPVVHRTAFTGEFTNEILLELLSEYGPAESGRAFDYDNLPYNILGLVLDAVDPAGWKDVVEREVLAPLGMTETSARVSRLDPGRLALPHRITQDGAWDRLRLAKTDATMHAAGGHFATARDLARFTAAHATGGELEGRRVFPREAIDVTHVRHAAQDRDFGPYHRFGWGYGWDLATYEGDTLLQRFGGFTGYRSHVSFMPRHGIGVVVLVNGDGPAPSMADLVAGYVYDRLLGKPDLAATYDARLESFLARLPSALQTFRSRLAERAARLAPLPHPLAGYAGTYENPAWGRMTWSVVAGGLQVHAGAAHDRAEVYAAAEDQVRVELTGSGEVVDFAFEPGSDQASSLEYSGQRFERVEDGE